MIKVGLIGAGAIGSAVLTAFREVGVEGHRIAAVLARSRQLDAVRASVSPDVVVTDDGPTFLAAEMDLVVEAAGHDAATAFAPAVLERGCDFYLISVGILADENVNATVQESAQRGGSKVVIPSGALAGFDGLRAMAMLGLTRVVYTSTKPPHAWDGTPGQDAIRIHDTREPLIIFEGKAAEAARLYPRNANLAAAVAIAGCGFERTRVRLISDPSAQENIGALEAEGDSNVFNLTMRGSSFGENPKSSAVTSASIIAALGNRSAQIIYA